MSAFVGGTDMPWGQVDRIYCAPGQLSRARAVTEAPPDFPIHESPLIDGLCQALITAKAGLDYPWQGLRL